MKNPLLIIIMNSILCLSCNSQSNKSIVNSFISAYNKKDSIVTFKYLHKDFVEIFEKDTTILSKVDYSKNYAWGKVMNDRMEFKIIKVEDDRIETISTYHSDRDSILNVIPYKSIRKYFIEKGQIIKILEGDFSGDKKYENQKRRDKYNAFFDWLFKKYKLTISDFEFDKGGAEKLKIKLIEYSKI